MPGKAPDENRYWLDDPRNVKKIIRALYLVCAVLAALDLLALAGVLYHKHAHFSFEELPNFYGFYGFLSYCFIVLSAKALRRVLKRDEDYYD